MEKFKADMGELSSKDETIKEEMSQLQSTSDQLTLDIIAYKKQIMEANDEKAAMDEEIKQLKAKTESAENDSKREMDKLNAAAATNDEKHKEELSELQSTSDQLTIDILGFKKQIMESNEEMEKLKKGNAENDALKGKLEESEKEIETLKDSVKELTDKCDSLTSDLNAAKEQAADENKNDDDANQAD